MPFPTTQWGNQGTLNGIGADVYSTLPGPSASVPGSADGPVLGNFTVLADGSAVQFLQTVATTAANVACQISAWQNVYQVTPTTAINQLVVAVNDLALQSLTANYFTWFKVRGLAFPLVASATAAKAIVASSATAGTLYAATAGTDLQGDMVNTALVGGSAAASPVYMQ
jgi:hypothetical protein